MALPNTNDARINAAVNEIIARLRLLLGSDNLPIFKTAYRGAIMIWPNVKPSIAQLPALRVWYQPSEDNMGTSSFVIAGDVGGKSGTTQLLDLDVYCYSTDKDEFGEPIDLQARLMEIKEAMISWLNDQPDGQHFNHTDTLWGFTRVQKVKSSFGSVMKKFGGVHTLPPPWYTLTVTVSIDVYPA